MGFLDIKKKKSKGKIAYVALDVAPYLFRGSSTHTIEIAKNLVQNERVIVTPHSIGQSHEAIEEKGEGVIKAIEDHINAKKL